MPQTYTEYEMGNNKKVVVTNTTDLGNNVNKFKQTTLSNLIENAFNDGARHYVSFSYKSIFHAFCGLALQNTYCNLLQQLKNHLDYFAQKEMSESYDYCCSLYFLVIEKENVVRKAIEQIRIARHELEKIPLIESKLKDNETQSETCLTMLDKSLQDRKLHDLEIKLEVSGILLMRRPENRRPYLNYNEPLEVEELLPFIKPFEKHLVLEQIVKLDTLKKVKIQFQKQRDTIMVNFYEAQKTLLSMIPRV